jgi:hypothetical protein
MKKKFSFCYALWKVSVRPLYINYEVKVSLRCLKVMSRFTLRTYSLWGRKYKRQRFLGLGMENFGNSEMWENIFIYFKGTMFLPYL